MDEAHEQAAGSEGKLITAAIGVLVGAERLVFVLVGALFFVAAFVLAIRSVAELWWMITGPRTDIIVAGAAFLNLMLLVLMMVELAYTVLVSLRGAVLAAEPFLIVGLIAVIRRILVITINDVSNNAAQAGGAPPGAVPVSGQPAELAVLTGVVLAFVVSIMLLRRRGPHVRTGPDVPLP